MTGRIPRWAWLAAVMAGGLGTSAVWGLSFYDTHVGERDMSLVEAEQYEWPSGALDLINDDSRVVRWQFFFSGLPNDVWQFGYDCPDAEVANRLIGQLAKIETPERVIVLSPERYRDTPEFREPREPRYTAEFALGSQRFIDQWFLHLLKVDEETGMRRFGVRLLSEPPKAMVPTLTLYLGSGVIDLEELKIPTTIRVATGTDDEARAQNEDSITAGIDAYVKEHESRRTAATRPASSPAPTHAEATAWGREVEGLRMRLSAPQGTEFRRSEGLPLKVEIRNFGQERMDYRRMAVVPEVIARDGGGSEVRLESLDRPPVNDHQGQLSPGQTLIWDLGLERLRANHVWKAGVKLELLVRFQVRGKSLGKELEGPIHVLAAPPLTITLHNDYPARLKMDEHPKQWSPSTTLLYHEQGIWWGSTWLRVDGQGRALLMRSRFGHVDEEIPPGIYSTTLTKVQLDALADLLWEHEYKMREEKLPPTDVGRTTLVFSMGGSAAWSQFEEPAEKREPALAELRAGMRSFLVVVVKASELGADVAK